MPRGGKRTGAGRRRVKPELPAANKTIATMALGQPAKDKWLGEPEAWRSLLGCSDDRLRFDVMKYLTDKRDGKPVQTVNHVHDKPIEVNHTHTLVEVIQKARLRAGTKWK